MSIFLSSGPLSDEVGFTSSLAADFEGHTPANVPFHKETFVPTHSTAVIDVSVAGEVRGSAHVSIGLLVAEGNLTTLRQNAQFHPPIVGAQFFHIGKIAPPEGAGTVSRRCVVKNLKAGKTHTVHLEYVITGGSEEITLDAAAAPQRSVVTADHQKLYVADSSLNAIWPVRIGQNPDWTFDGGSLLLQRGPRIAPAGGISHNDCSITPDGTKAVFVDFFGDRAVILTTADETTVAVAMPLAATNPLGVVCVSNTEAWVASTTDSVITPLNLTNNTFGASVAIGAGGLRNIESDGTNLWITESGGAAETSFWKRPIAGGAATEFDITPNRPWGVATTSTRLYISSENVTASTTKIEEYDISAGTATLLGTINTTAQDPTGPATLALSPDGRFVFAMFPNGRFAYYSTGAQKNPDLPQYARFDSPLLAATGRSITISKQGYIFVHYNTKLQLFHGSRFMCRVEGGDGPGGVTQEFFSEYAELVFTDAREA